MTNTKPIGIRISATSRVGDFMYFEEPLFVKDHCFLRQSRFGAFTFVGDYNVMTRAKVGRYCSFGPGCRINPGQHPIDGLTTSALSNNNPFAWFTGEAPQHDPTYEIFEETVIGNDVWIGAEAIVMGGVRIGDGAVIGAGSVVTRDIPPYVIAVGVPAKPIRARFDDEITRRLLDLQWWRFDLSLWSAKGDLPLTRSMDHDFLDDMQRSIEAGRAPLIAGRACKVTFQGTKATLGRLEDASQSLP